jgi:two-component system, chemotaxis family, CheB/CheR fusion protein
VIQNALTTQRIELPHATVADGKVWWPGPIALELEAEAITPWLFLDRNLNIERFSAGARELLKILPSEHGQPLTRLVSRLGFAGLVDDAAVVLQSLVEITREMRFERDQWYLARLMPYRNGIDQVDGVVVAFLDISRFKEREAKLLQSRRQMEALTEKLQIVVTEQNARIRDLASKMLIAEQKVKSSLSRLLHDELQQLLVSIQIRAGLISEMLPATEQALREQMQELHETANVALDVTRQLTINLKSPVMLNEELMEALIRLAALMKKRHGLTVELKGTLRPRCPKPEVSALLFQTVRELLFNVVKHAGVDRALVEVAEEANFARLAIAVSDQGRGFDVAATMAQQRESDNTGLLDIRNRLSLCGGQFRVESQPGRGTRATVVVLI